MIYVMSDVHGQYQLFVKMLNKIKFNDSDTLYIIGDVIDRGPESIEILKYIISHKNIILLIGNHEHMMLDYYKYKTNKHKALWFNNGGEITKSQMDTLSTDEQVEILEYLANAPLIIPNLNINGKNFYLVHARPLNKKKKLLYKDAMIFDIEEAVWDRDFACYPIGIDFKKRFFNYYVIFGHTPTIKLNYRKMTKKGYPLISRFNKHVIGIDCGCSYINRHNSIKGQLSCLRLDDFKEYYIH